MFTINRAFSTPKSLLSIDAKLEKKTDQQQGGREYWSEAIFFKINHYQKKQDVTMLFSAHDLRALSIALDDLYLTGESTFMNYTAKRDYKNTMSLGFSNKAYFINIERTGSDSSSLKIEHLFGSYSVRAFSQTLRLIADETEKALFAAQSGRGYKDE